MDNLENIKKECELINSLIYQKQHKALISHPWLLKSLKNIFGDLPNNELLYLGLNPNIITTCNISNKRKTFINKNEGYAKFCSPTKECVCYKEYAKEKRINDYKLFDDEKKKKRLENFKKTNILKFGVENPTKNQNIKNKIKETVKEKYGVESILFLKENIKKKNSIETRNKIKNKFQEKYGVSELGFIKLGQEKLNLLMNKEEFKQKILKNDKNTTKIIEDLKIDRTTFLKWFYKHSLDQEIPLNGFSFIETKLKDMLEKYNINYISNIRKIIPPYEIDFFLPDYNIGIELNGLYWHSEENIKDNLYHFNKFKEAENKGIKLLQFFEDEVKNKFNIIENMVLYLLGKSNKIGARQTIIKEISSEEVSNFLNSYHILGATKLTSIKLGAFYNDTLVGVMTFQKNKKGYELTRFATSIHVSGLFSKFLKYFIKKYPCNYIKSFSDNRVSNGNLYLKNGFKFEKNIPPAYWYTDFNKIYHRFNFRKKYLIKKYGFDGLLTEKEMVKELGYSKIYDAGKKEWVLEIDLSLLE